MSVPLSSKKTIPFTPASLSADTLIGKPIIFDIRVPNYQDRDEIGIKLYRMNLRQVSTDQVRALMVSELYEIQDPELPADVAETKAEELAIWLENHWTQSNLDAADETEWEIQERVRVEDELELGEPIEAKPRPHKRTTVRDRARATLLTQDIIERSPRVRNALADQISYDIGYKTAIVRLHLADIHGLKTRISMSGGLVDMACIEALREELEDYSPTAYTELFDAVNEQYNLPSAEVGNSVSPRGSISPPSGSPTESDVSEIIDGSSPNGERDLSSNIEPTPDAESERITEPLSASSTDADSRTALSDGRMTDH